MADRDRGGADRPLATAASKPVGKGWTDSLVDRHIADVLKLSHVGRDLQVDADLVG